MHSEPLDATGSGAADSSEDETDVAAPAQPPRAAAAKRPAPRSAPQRTPAARKTTATKTSAGAASEKVAPRTRKPPAQSATARARSGGVTPRTAANRPVRSSPASPSAQPAAEAPEATVEPTPAPTPKPDTRSVVLAVSGLSKSFDDTVAVRAIDLHVRTGSIFGIVGPNGAGKTTTLSMVTGLLRPDSGTVTVHGADVWADPVAAKRQMGVLPDRLRLFDRLTGAQLLYYSGTLRGLDRATVRKRSSDLAAAFGLDDALGRLVTDYSAGMMKKIALAAAMIHSPRVLILDEPFEAVDPVSAANVIEILQRYAAAGGTVVLSSHSMDLIQRICDSVAIIVRGEVLASGTVDEVRRGSSLENRFIELAGGRKPAEGMEWLHTFSA